MTRKFIYWDGTFAHLSCPICLDDDCEGHPALGIRAYPRKEKEK